MPFTPARTRRFDLFGVHGLPRRNAQQIGLHVLQHALVIAVRGNLAPHRPLALDKIRPRLLPQIENGIHLHPRYRLKSRGKHCGFPDREPACDGNRQWPRARIPQSYSLHSFR